MTPARPPARTNDALQARARVAASLAQAQVLDRGGYPYLVHPLLDGTPPLDATLLEAFAAWAAAQAPLREADVLLAPEAMGIHLAAAASLRTGIPLAVARKRAYGLPGELVVPAKTGYGSSTLHVNGLARGASVAIVDDVLSTGGTLDALLAALRAAGLRVTCAVVALDKGGSRQGLTRRHGVPVLACVQAQVTLGGVRLLEPS